MKVRLDLPYFWLKACLILHLLFFPSNMRNLCKMRLNGNAMPDIQYIHNNVCYHYHCFCYFKVFIRYACFPKSLPPTTLLVNVSFLWPPLPEHPAWWGPVSTLPDDSSLTPWFPRVLGIPGFVLSSSHVLSLYQPFHPWRYYLQKKTARNPKWNSFPRRKSNYTPQPSAPAVDAGLSHSPQSPELGFLTDPATEGSQTWKKFP